MKDDDALNIKKLTSAQIRKEIEALESPPEPDNAGEAISVLRKTLKSLVAKPEQVLAS